MERLMPHMKSFRHDGTYDSWAKVSMELVCGMMCKQFTSFYTKLRRDAEREEVERTAEQGGATDGEMADPLWSRKKTTMPSKRNLPNRILVANILGEAKVGTINESISRIDEMFCWRALDVVLEKDKVKGKYNDKTNPDAAPNRHLRDERVFDRPST
jgi:hypothetical protein